MNTTNMTIKITSDNLGRTLTISGLIPSTEQEDRAEMIRLWKAQSESKAKPYKTTDKLLASGGCK